MAIVAGTVQLAESVSFSEADRRKYPRFPCEGTARVIVLGGALIFEGELRNLSSTGCCIATEVKFALERGTHVEVLMSVNHVSVRVGAGVRSNHKVRGVGLEFMKMSPRCSRDIQYLIGELNEQPAAGAKK